MNGERTAEQRITDWLRETTPFELPDRVLDETLDRTSSTSQLRPLPAWRILSIRRDSLRVAVGLTAIVVLMIGGAYLIGRQGTPSVGVNPSATVAPTAVPSAVVSTAPSAPVVGIETPLGPAIVALDGTVRQGLDLPPDARSPALSPNGSSVVLLTSSSEIADCPECIAARPVIVPVGASRGTAFFPVVGIEHVSVAQPAWSPNGRRVAFAGALTGDTDTDIYVVTVAGVTAGTPSMIPATRLTTDPAVDGWPAWSPDGTTIYYVNDGSQRADESGFSPTQEIWSVPSAGGAPTRLTTNDVADLQPDVGADGTVAWWHADEIWAMGPGGQNQRRLADFDATTSFNPRWSPEGTKLALLRYDSTKRAHPDPGLGLGDDLPLLEVIVLDVARGAVTDVGPRVITFYNPPSWTPDGQALLINRYDDGS